MPILLPSSVIKSAPVNVVDLLKTKHEIPDYQRDYVWKKSTVSQLWNDLVRHYQSISKADEFKNEPEGYFLGSIVVVAPEDVGRHEVIDGQQRLTTLTCLVSLLNGVLHQVSDQQFVSGYRLKLGGLLAEFVDNKFEANLQFSGEKLNTFFVKICTEEVAYDQKMTYWESDTHAVKMLGVKNSPAVRLRDTFGVLHDALEKFVNQADSKEKRLKSFIQFVCEGIIFLRIHALSHSHAYTIFESLNNRGVPLTQADLIKFELIRATKGNSVKYQELVDYWGEMKELLGDQGVVQLPEFMHYSFLSNGQSCKSSELLKTLIQSGVTASSDKATDYAQHLHFDALNMHRLLNPSIEANWSDRTKELLLDLRDTLQIKYCYPYLLAVLRLFPDDSNLKQKHFHLVVNFAFRYMKVLGNDYEMFGEIAARSIVGLSESDSLASSSKRFC